jgi:hypothetical protein
MALTHTTAVRDGITNYVVDLIDAGAGAGTLIITTGAEVEVATLTFTDGAFDASGSAGGNAAGVATAETITSDTDATGNAGDVDEFIIKDSNSLEVVRGSVGSGSGDIDLSSLSISSGDTVSVSALTYTAPA